LPSHHPLSTLLPSCVRARPRAVCVGVGYVCKPLQITCKLLAAGLQQAMLGDLPTMVGVLVGMRGCWGV
jgi:hypothetical protein